MTVNEIIDASITSSSFINSPFMSSLATNNLATNNLATNNSATDNSITEEVKETHILSPLDSIKEMSKIVGGVDNFSGDGGNGTNRVREELVIRKVVEEITTVRLNEKVLLTLKEAADYTGIGLNSIRKIISDRNSKFVVRVGSKWFVNRVLLEDWLKEAAENREVIVKE